MPSFMMKHASSNHVRSMTAAPRILPANNPHGKAVDFKLDEWRATSGVYFTATMRSGTPYLRNEKIFPQPYLALARRGGRLIALT